jgi:hypothetical protein
MKKMKKSLALIIILFLTSPLFAQDLTGQWKGQFSDKSTSFIGWGGNHCDYVLEIECAGTNVSGYSYTYFNEGGKRYYTICRLKGTLDKASKFIEVTEVERTKTNVPNNIRNCFQIHRLTYFKHGDDQTLEGSWVPAPNQEGDCGFGTTSLTRRVLQKNPAILNNTVPPVVKQNNKPPVIKPNTTAPPPVVKTVPKPVTPPVVINKPKPQITAPVVKEKPKNNTAIAKTPNNTPPVVKNDVTPVDVPKPEKLPPPVKETEKPEVVAGFEKRNNDLLKTIEIESDTFRVDLYDNGEIDGDSISLFFNGKLLLSHNRLSEKAITLKLKVDESRDVNELIMYAENLGTIPPNTALMVVTDGDNRYEVRISSDLQKSGEIRFVHRPKKAQ